LRFLYLFCNLIEWRGAWAQSVNAFLEKADVARRVDHRSYERQGVEKIPTIHLGSAAAQMERRGIRTGRGERNREIEISNQKLRQLRARIRKAKNWLEKIDETAAPSLADALQNILKSDEGKTRRQTIIDLKTAANMFVFLRENRISDLAQLTEKLKEMYGRVLDASAEIKPIERRLNTLEKHLEYAADFTKYRKIYKAYKAQKPRKQAEFYEKHRAEIALYKAARDYLKPLLKDGKTIPVNYWKSERERLTAKKSALTEKYRELQAETKNVENIRRNVEEILREAAPPQRARGKSQERG
jgi:hypothetical protein